jgi:hypothetical protein
MQRIMKHIAWQGCHRVVTGVSQRCYKGVTGVSEVRYRGEHLRHGHHDEREQQGHGVAGVL